MSIKVVTERQLLAIASEYMKVWKYRHCTKMKCSLKSLFSKCDQIRCLSRSWFLSHLLKQSLMVKSIFCALRNIITKWVNWRRFRSSHRRCSVRKCALRNFAKFTENICAKVSFLKRVSGTVSFL